VLEVADSAYGTIALFGVRFHELRLSAQLGNSSQAGYGLDHMPYNPEHATRSRLHTPGLGWSHFARHYSGSLG
jgi:hypothetical protein